MPRLDRKNVKQCLDEFDLETLFTQELGWDRGGSDLEIPLKEGVFPLEAIAQKRGMVAYQYIAKSADEFPLHATRLKIERRLAKSVHEHIIIFATHDKSAQCWHWVKREPGQTDRPRQHPYHRNQSGESLMQKLQNIVFTLDEEDSIGIADVNARVRAAFDVENVTKKFYDRFKNEHGAFLEFINGIKAQTEKEWYASLMLNRMMFIYFIQKRGFLDGDTDYLKNRLQLMQEKHGKDRFQNFYRLFLLRLFHEGLGQPESEREPELAELLGKVPYLNGGLFDVHELERDNKDITIPDEAFDRVFRFFDAYDWHLDNRPLHNDSEINPDVLGYIFEKYINQKQMGAYYTKEDITGYISRNTIIPFLFNEAEKTDRVAFEPGGGVWRLLQDAPDRYFWESARHGITYNIHDKKEIEKQELPPEIAAGLNDVSKRGDWNRLAPDEYGLPNETWREHISRRRHYEDAYKKVASGKINAINDLITLNLKIEQFAIDVIVNSEGPDLVRAFWKAISKISVLDPTCGSGAFLFAALNILQPIYETCIEAMRGLLDDLERSQRKHHSKKMIDFKNVIKQMGDHASQPYFILKSIIINNLYGVDIMDEAVEICKLRLFLKLVAQLETYDQIEPLPDIDFNIRAGNTLIGFSSIDEVEEVLSEDLVALQTDLPDIKERAEIADRAFNQFREMQTERGKKAEEYAKAKTNLRERLDELRNRLNAYLAPEYGFNLDKADQHERWIEEYQAFHWFVEFYGIMENGGFDVIIGNPPYLEKNEVPYVTKFFETESGGAIHAMCVERSINICQNNGSISMILPMALVSTQRMGVLLPMLENKRDCWFSSFAWRPGKLFDQVNRALTIFVANKAKNSGDTFSTSYIKWHASGRDFVFPNLRHAICPRNRTAFWLPKFANSIELSIFKKYVTSKKFMLDFVQTSQHKLYYKSTGGVYWKTFTNFPPKYTRNGVHGTSSRQKHFSMGTDAHVLSAVAILSSDIFWWWYTITSNMRDLNPYDWQNFPVPEVAMNDSKVAKSGENYMDYLKKNSTMLVRNQSTTGRTEIESFPYRTSRKIICEINALVAPHYGLNEEELDFISNYDIKYRLSSDADE